MFLGFHISLGLRSLEKSLNPILRHGTESPKSKEFQGARDDNTNISSSVFIIRRIHNDVRLVNLLKKINVDEIQV